MEKTAAATLPEAILSRTAARSLTGNMMLVLGASLLLALSAQVSVPVPFSLVPMTLQPLALLLIGAALGSKRGMLAAVAYLVEGASGLPVFANGRSGLAVILGPTAGYLIAFPFAAFIAGFVTERGWGFSYLRTAAGMTAALAIIHLSGWMWLSVWLGKGTTLVAAISPFLAGDLVKIAIATILVPSAQRLLGARQR